MVRELEMRCHGPSKARNPRGRHRRSANVARFVTVALPDQWIKAASIGTEYEAQCCTLCYGPYPAWGEVQARFVEIRDLL